MAVHGWKRDGGRYQDAKCTECGMTPGAHGVEKMRGRTVTSHPFKMPGDNK